MRKKDEISNPRSCLSKAQPDEMIFVLRGIDIAAPDVIRYWVEKRIVLGKNKYDDPQIINALKDAKIMEKERVKKSV